MKKITIKKVIDFSKKSKKNKIVFLKKHNTPPLTTSSGGNYWISSNSAVSNAFRANDNSVITEKIKFILDSKKKTSIKRSEDMYQKNIDVLERFKTFNFSKWVDVAKLNFLCKKSDLTIIDINGVPIQVNPNHIFTYEDKGKTYIGAISFISKVDGYSKSDLAMFADSLFRYLEVNHSSEYIIEPTLCLAIDLSNLFEVSYEDIISGKISSILDLTTIEINNIVA